MRDASSHQKKKKEKEKKTKNTLQTLGFILLEMEKLKAGVSIREKIKIAFIHIAENYAWIL